MPLLGPAKYNPGRELPGFESLSMPGNQEKLMDEKFSDRAPSAKPSEDRLDSWKEIAAYLNRDVTTVQRWEKREGMPVHRHLHDKLGSVYASRAELDARTRGSNPAASVENGSGGPVASSAGGAAGVGEADGEGFKRGLGL